MNDMKIIWRMKWKETKKKKLGTKKNQLMTILSHCNDSNIVSIQTVIFMWIFHLGLRFVHLNFLTWIEQNRTHKKYCTVFRLEYIEHSNFTHTQKQNDFFLEWRVFQAHRLNYLLMRFHWILLLSYGDVYNKV